MKSLGGRVSAAQPGVVYDAGALLAAERNVEAIRAFHRRLLGRRIRPVVPAVVLAQAWHGGPQPSLSRLLSGCVIEALAENAARDVGRLLAASRTSDVVDAAVVVSAASRGDLVVTSDPGDLDKLSAAFGVRLALHVI